MVCFTSLRAVHGVRLANARLFVVVAVCLTAARVPAATSHWVEVGNPGNANDTTGYGAVADAFRIGKFEWTNAQYVEFLNAIDPDGSNPNAVYNSFMGSTPRGGISFNAGVTAGSKYAVITNFGDKPVNYVSWWDAARVANWLHNGAQTYGSTDASASAPQNIGAYLVETSTIGNVIPKTAAARYWIPTENEWYKAAYYNGDSSSYTLYGNGFGTAPTPVTATTVGVGTDGSASPLVTGNFANYGQGANWNGSEGSWPTGATPTSGNVTSVGTNGGSSFYGAFDMSGNVWEWIDASGGIGLAVRRGGAWQNASGAVTNLSSSVRQTAQAATSVESDGMGFRVAVPEPASVGYAAAGGAWICGWWAMKRWRRRRA